MRADGRDADMQSPDEIREGAGVASTEVAELQRV